MLDKKYSLAIKGLEGFSHIYLIYHFHKAKAVELQVKPFLSKQTLGVFAVRAPNRPNSIGLSIVNLEKIIPKENVIEILVEGVDMLDQTPLLDIKPYISDFDAFTNVNNGWYEHREIEKIQSDSRFTKE